MKLILFPWSRRSAAKAARAKALAEQAVEAERQRLAALYKERVGRRDDYGAGKVWLELHRATTEALRRAA